MVEQLNDEQRSREDIIRDIHDFAHNVWSMGRRNGKAYLPDPEVLAATVLATVTKPLIINPKPKSIVVLGIDPGEHHGDHLAFVKMRKVLEENGYVFETLSVESVQKSQKAIREAAEKYMIDASMLMRLKEPVMIQLEGDKSEAKKNRPNGPNPSKNKRGAWWNR